MTTSAPSRVSTSAFFYTVDDLRPSTIHLLRGFETTPGSDDEEFDTDSAIDEDKNGSAQDEEQGKIKSSNLTLVSSDPNNIARNCDSDYLIADGICSVDVNLEPGSASTEIQTGHLSLAHHVFDKMPQLRLCSRI
ncbi:hypothetical protein U1Q18_004503 [Sarracenia purpurea var. burkii]